MPQPLPKVRFMGPLDAEPLMAMCKRLHRENGCFSFSEKSVGAVIDLGLKTVASFSQSDAPLPAIPTIIGVIDGPRGIEASTCLQVAGYYYSEDLHLAELWNFVENAYRVSRNAEALIEYGKQTAVNMGIPFLTGIITSERMSGKVRMYRRHLGNPTGAFFIFNGPPKWQPKPMESHAELRNKLGRFSQLCNDAKMTSALLRELAPVLREAANVLSVEDKLWGSKKGEESSLARTG